MFARVRLFLLILLMFAVAQPAATLDLEHSYRLEIILDSKQPAAARTEQVRALRAAADAGLHPAQCVLGRLGVQKLWSPSAFADGDYGDALLYLNSCVMGGDLDAMLAFAEVELRAHRPLEAMIWVQAYLKLAQVFGSEMVNQAAPYKAGLIARIERAYRGKRPSNEEVLEYVGGLLAKHGERIQRGCEEGGCAWSQRILPAQEGRPPHVVGGGKSSSGRFARDFTSAEDELTYASFVVEVDESGRAARVLALESYPDTKAARKLASHPRSRRFNAAVPGTGMRYMHMTVYIDNKAFDLVPNAPPSRRPALR